MTEFQKTEDRNVIKRIDVVQTEIRLDELVKEIVALQSELENLPLIIECPKKVGKDIQELIEKHNRMLPVKNELKKKIKEKQELLELLKNL